MKDESVLYPSGKNMLAPVKIQFDTIIDHGSYVTGLATYVNPAGVAFQIKVHGQLEPVTRFGEEAVIQRLEVLPDSPLNEQLMASHEEAVLAFQRLQWHERVHNLLNLVDNADLDLLLDTERLLASWQGEPKPGLLTPAAQPDSPTLFQGDEEIPEKEEDLIIEIEAPAADELSASPIYLKIDPTVPQGFSHIYVLIGAASAWARTTAQAGDPDLYLYQDGALRAYSQSNGPSDQVYAAGAAAQWRLNVFGCTTATYTLEGYWTRFA